MYSSYIYIFEELNAFCHLTFYISINRTQDFYLSYDFASSVESHVAKAVLELLTHLPLPPKGWYYRHVPPCWAWIPIFSKFQYHLSFSGFTAVICLCLVLTLTILLGKRWYLIVGLICLSLMIRELSISEFFLAI